MVESPLEGTSGITSSCSRRCPMYGTATTPDALTSTKNNREYLNGIDSKVHAFMAIQPFYLSRSARPDIRTAMTPLFARLRTQDVDGYKKLAREMTFLQGTIDCQAMNRVCWTHTRQKLVTQISAETELVGMHDVLPDILYTKNLLGTSVFPIIENVLHRITRVALTKKWGQWSSKRTKHRNLSYFF
jgi:hypothetical protein